MTKRIGLGGLVVCGAVWIGARFFHHRVTEGTETHRVLFIEILAPAGGAEEGELFVGVVAVVAIKMEPVGDGAALGIGE